MSRKLFILALTAMFLVFLSGVGVGVVGHRAAEPMRFRSILVEELDLTPEQRSQIEQIWKKAMENAPPPPVAEMEKADAQRKRKIDELLNPEQRTRYAVIQEQFEARLRELSEAGHVGFAAAEEQTKRLLTPAQRAKYEQLLAHPKPKVLFFSSVHDRGEPPSQTQPQ